MVGNSILIALPDEDSLVHCWPGFEYLIAAGADPGLAYIGHDWNRDQIEAWLEYLNKCTSYQVMIVAGREHLAFSLSEFAVRRNQLGQVRLHVMPVDLSGITRQDGSSAIEVFQRTCKEALRFEVSARPEFPLRQIRMFSVVRLLAERREELSVSAK